MAFKTFLLFSFKTRRGLAGPLALIPYPWWYLRASLNGQRRRTQTERERGARAGPASTHAKNRTEHSNCLLVLRRPIQLQPNPVKKRGRNILCRAASFRLAHKAGARGACRAGRWPGEVLVASCHVSLPRPLVRRAVRPGFPCVHPWATGRTNRVLLLPRNMRVHRRPQLLVTFNCHPTVDAHFVLAAFGSCFRRRHRRVLPGTGTRGNRNGARLGRKPKSGEKSRHANARWSSSWTGPAPRPDGSGLGSGRGTGWWPSSENGEGQLGVRRQATSLRACGILSPTLPSRAELPPGLEREKFFLFIVHSCGILFPFLCCIALGCLWR